MKRLALIFFVCGMLVAGFAGVQSAHAQDAQPLSPAHIEHIRQNCVAAQTTIKRVHDNDTFLRNNSGRLYELISTKLMAPLNSRIALNRHEGLKLAATTIEYDLQRESFSDNYRRYHDAVTRAETINCANNPEEFYSHLQTAREYRKRVHEDTEVLAEMLRAYEVEFESFASQLKEDK